MPNQFETVVSLLNFSHMPIDVHSHFDHGTPYDCPEDELHFRGLAYVESVYRNANVKQVGICTFASVVYHPECVVEENEYIHKLIDERDWVYQWVVVDPRQKETYAQAERMLPHPKVLGIKIHPDFHGYNILDYGDEVFSFANRNNAVVLMHPQHIMQMPGLLNKYPDAKLIIAHIGSFEHVDAIAQAIHGNIYTDTSGSASVCNNIVEYAVQRVGSEKILFGTDTYSLGCQFGRIALSALPQEDMENILWKNAMNMFPKAFGNG